MKYRICCGIAAVLALPVSAGAQDKTLQPNDLTVTTSRAPLKLGDQQAAVIRDALVTENTEQKTPAKFEPKVGAKIPQTMTVDVMPQRLVAREPALEPYGYAKLAKDVLVIDPMKKTIIAVLPRQEPSTLKDPDPADWAKTRGRELTGQAPEPRGATENDKAPQAAGDSGDKSNGVESTTKEK
jgi:hypothetical protein